MTFFIGHSVSCLVLIVMIVFVVSLFHLTAFTTFTTVLPGTVLHEVLQTAVRIVGIIFLNLQRCVNRTSLVSLLLLLLLLLLYCFYFTGFS